MRRISIHATRIFLAIGVSPNQLTGAMTATGVAAGAALLVPGVAGAILAAVLVQLYLLLDCSDGEVARWTRRTSVQGVYLDRVGHYFAEAALMVGLGLRAAELTPTGYAVLGTLAALCVVLVKAETDLVDVARARSGLPAAVESAHEPRSRTVGRLRSAASLLGVHRATGAVEASLLVLLAAVVDAARGDLLATRALLVLLVAVALLMVVLHLASVLLSQRLT
jgi:phosphatidylglycerophosphate synthase